MASMPSNSSKKSAFRKWLILPLILTLIILLGYFTVKRYLSNQPKIRQQNGRINFALLGISGGNYQPPDLTDIIMFVSYNKRNGKTVVFSLPRDLWMPSIESKINAAYHYGKLDLSRKVLEEVIGQPIHYFFVLDFEGFEKAVDFLGGIEISVERAFDDYKYPIAGRENDECGGDKEYKCRYEHVHFEKGVELMSGERALKFVRSRNADGEEGTDAGRNSRQQKFLVAFKNKLLSSKVFLNPRKIIGLFDIFSFSVTTDLKKEEYLNFGLSLLKFNSQAVKTEVLGGSPEGEGLFYHPKTHSSGQWVLVPQDKGWEKIHRWVAKNLP
jgi:LCP family protein required for cell wall assembly